MFLSADQKSWDLLWQCIDNEGKEDSEDDKNDESNDVFLELLPDEEDEGLHRVDEPVKARGWTTRGMTGKNLGVYTWIEVTSG